MQQGGNGVNGVNNAGITPPQPSPSGEGVLANSLQALSEGNRLTSFLPLESQVGEGNGLNPENQLSNNLLSNSPLDMKTLTLLLGILQQVNKEKGDKAKPEDFIKVLENILAQENNNEV